MLVAHPTELVAVVSCWSDANVITGHTEITAINDLLIRRFADSVFLWRIEWTKLLLLCIFIRLNKPLISTIRQHGISLADRMA